MDEYESMYCVPFNASILEMLSHFSKIAVIVGIPLVIIQILIDKPWKKR